MLLAIHSITIGQSLTQTIENQGFSTESCVQYTGMLDGSFELEMLLCDDIGVYKMTSSSDLYKLDIEKSVNGIILTEWDDNEDNSAIINLSKTSGGYEGIWQHSERPSNYTISISQAQQSTEAPRYSVTTLTGAIGNELVDIVIHPETMLVEIYKKYGNKARIKSIYECNDEACKKMSVKINGLGDIDNIEILQLQKNDYKVVPYQGAKRMKATVLKINGKIENQSKSYADYRLLLLAEYPKLGRKGVDTYFEKIQSQWVQKTSKDLRIEYTKDEGIIVDDRMKYQAYSWVDVELWTEDFVSGVIYKQYSWEDEVLATAFHYDIDNDKALDMTTAWNLGFDPDDSIVDSNYGHHTWVVGYDALCRVYFDRVNGIQRELYPYKNIEKHIKKNGWLDKILSQQKVKR